MPVILNTSYLVIIIVLISCTPGNKQVKENGYEITGHVKNIPASQIYMQAMVLDSAGQPKWPVIDSADYNNGSFVLHRDTVLIEPAWATGIFYIDSVTKKKVFLGFNNRYLSTKENPLKYGSIILENSSISIDGDVKDKNGLTINGAKETDFNFKYGLMNPPYRQLDAIDKKIDSATTAADSSLLASYKNQKNKVLQNYKQNFIKIISRHPSRFQALSNIYNNAKYFTPGELQILADNLDDNLLTLPTGKKLIEFIKQGKKLLPGNIFPDFNYSDTTGKKRTLNDVKGRKGTLIVFWASWCGPCRKEIPDLKKLYDQYYSKGISIVSISVDNNANAWQEAVLKEQMPWFNLSNLPGNYEDINSQYNIQAIPLMFLLNKENKILLANPGSIEKVKEKLIEKNI